MVWPQLSTSTTVAAKMSYAPHLHSEIKGRAYTLLTLWILPAL